MKALLDNAVEHVRRAGATVKPGWPAGVHPEELLKNYLFYLDAMLFGLAPPEEQERRRKAYATSGAPTPGALASFADWQQQNLRRLAFRGQWQAYFDQVDVFLSPVAFCPAFPQDHSEPLDQRMISTPTGPRHYLDLFNWIAPASLTGCPATVAPIGRTQDGLPVGIQIMGPFWEDATTIGFAKFLAQEVGGFSAPPGFAS
jgi:amidase